MAELRFLLHRLNTTCINFSASTPGPGFFPIPPNTNNTIKVDALRNIVPKQNTTRPFPCAVDKEVLVACEVLAAQVPTRGG